MTTLIGLGVLATLVWAYRRFQPGSHPCLRCQSRLTYVKPNGDGSIFLDCLSCDYRSRLRPQTR